jgi:coenzyme F420 hydrogenase subunit beta
MIPEVISKVVDNNLCVGCGLCVSFCSNSSLKMKLDEYGFLVPEQIYDCNCDGSCLDVCPTNPDLNTTDRDLSKQFVNSSNLDENIGYYDRLLVGHSTKYRKTSSSGGITSYVCEELLKRKLVDRIISVKNKDGLTVYSSFSNPSQVIEFSKTRYFPTTLEKEFSKILENDEKVAIVGIGCFIKSIRLAQIKTPSLKKKIPFTIGIICGGLKSSKYTEFLLDSSNMNKTEKLSEIDYRKKNEKLPAIDYSFFSKNEKGVGNEIRMKELGDMWGTGLFKSSACDFCEDLTSELAEVSMGDAWLYPYINDGRGHNVVVIRNKIINNIFNEGSKNKDILTKELNINKFKEGQSGAINHKQNSLNFRVKKAKHKTQKKLFDIKINPLEKIIQRLRSVTRKKSHQIWKKHENAIDFNNEMKYYLLILKIFTRINHYIRKINKK